MRVCCVSDLHGSLPPDVPECDVLLVAGDVQPDSPDDAVERFLHTELPDWLASQRARHVVGIAGNHDFVARDSASVFRSLPWTYLENETTAVAGLTIWGGPWTPPFEDWAFMAEERELARMWAQIPDDVDVLLTHGPPRGILDTTPEGIAAGSTTLRARLSELPKLRLHAFGHIHGAYGTAVLSEGARLVNASIVNDAYEPVNAPVIVEI